MGNGYIETLQANGCEPIHCLLQILWFDGKGQINIVHCVISRATGLLDGLDRRIVHDGREGMFNRIPNNAQEFGFASDHSVGGESGVGNREWRKLCR